MIRSHFDILGLGPECTLDEVKSAHLDLTMLLQHQQVLKSKHTERFRSYLDESYQILSDTDWRNDHQKTIEGLYQRLSALEKKEKSLKSKLSICQERNKLIVEENLSLKATVKHLENEIQRSGVMRQPNFKSLQNSSTGSGTMPQDYKRFSWWWIVLFIFLLLWLYNVT